MTFVVCNASKIYSAASTKPRITPQFYFAPGNLFSFKHLISIKITNKQYFQRNFFGNAIRHAQVYILLINQQTQTRTSQSCIFVQPSSKRLCPYSLYSVITINRSNVLTNKHMENMKFVISKYEWPCVTSQILSQQLKSQVEMLKD